MVGYIGPNGAGKSTTHQDAHRHPRCRPAGACGSAGSTRCRSAASWPARIGVVFGQRTQLWWDLPLRDSFELLRHIYRVPRPRTPRACAELRRAARARRVPRHPGAPALARPAHARRADRRAAARPRAAVPRRADHRSRRREQGGGARVPRRAQRRAAARRVAHHPRPGRHRAALPAAARHRPRARHPRRRRSRRCTTGTARGGDSSWSWPSPGRR